MPKNTKKFYLPHERNLQNGIYLIIFVIITMLCLPLTPKPNNEAVGVLLPHNTSYTAINPNQVKIATTPPSNAVLIGKINTKIHYDSTSIGTDDLNLAKNIALSKQLAASYGANLVVVDNIGRSVTGGPLDGFVVYSEAYHD